MVKDKTYYMERLTTNEHDKTAVTSGFHSPIRAGGFAGYAVIGRMRRISSSDATRRPKNHRTLLHKRGQTMTVSVFGDKSKEPTSSDLDKVLGETATLLKDIEQHLLDQFGELTHEWRFYSKKAGWTLALAYKGRRVLHLIPQSGLFAVVFTLGKRAVSASKESNLPEEILSAIESAREYAEGRSIRFDVTTTEDVAVVKQLVAIKMSN